MNDKENQEKSSYEKLRFLATLFVLCLSTMAWAQMKVTGTVVDMMGEPIIGANVVESGNKTVGTITDGSPDKPGGLSIQLCKSEKKEFYIRYSS